MYLPSLPENPGFIYIYIYIYKNQLYSKAQFFPNYLLTLSVNCGIGLNPDEIKNISCNISLQTQGLINLGFVQRSLHTILIS